MKNAKIISVKIPLVLKLTVLFLSLWMLCCAGRYFCGRNIIFSGNCSGGAVISTAVPAEFDVSFDGLRTGEKTICELTAGDGRMLLRLRNQIAVENGRKKLAVTVQYAGNELKCRDIFPGIDNPEGRLNLKISADGRQLTLKVRERCKMYFNGFEKYGPVPLVLPAEVKIKISPEASLSMKIQLPGSWQKWDAFFKISGDILGFITISTVLYSILSLLQKTPFRTAPECAVPAGIAAAAAVLFASIIIWSIIEKEYSPALPPDIVIHNGFHPEPHEQFLYVFILLFSTLSLFVCNHFMMRRNIRYSCSWNHFAGILALLTVILCRKPENFLSGTMFLPGWLFTAAAAAAALTVIHYRGAYTKKLLFLPCAAAAFNILVLCKPYILRNFDFFDAHHYSVFTHPMWLVHSGFSPFENASTYGAYAFISAPFFMLTGFTSYSIDLFIIILMILTMFLLYFSLKQTLHVFLWRISAVAGIAGLFCLNGSPAVYPQYMPLRMLFPALMLFLTAQRQKNAYLKYIAGSVTAFAAIIWNPDTGCILLTAWTIYLVCTVVTGRNENKLLKLLVLPASGIAVTVLCITIHLACYGKTPDFSNLFATSFVFGKLGFLQLPMPYLGMWLINAVIYFAALSFSIWKILTRKMSDLDGFILFTTLLGCGLFSYYLGRSHDGNLPSVSYPAVILLAAAAERLRDRSWKIMRFTAVFLLFFITFKGVNSCRNLSDTTLEQRIFMEYFNKLCSDIENHLSADKKLFFTGYNESMIAVETGAKAPFCHPAVEELFRLKECRKYCAFPGSPTAAAIWAADMNCINSTMPQYSANILREIIKKRIGQNIPPNAMLMFKLEKSSGER